MTETIKRILTTIVLVSIIIILFMYGTNLSFVLNLFINVIIIYEWLRLTSKPRYFIFPFIILLVLLDLILINRYLFFLFFFLIILLIRYL